MINIVFEENEFEELKTIIVWAICEGYLVTENVQDLINKFNYNKEYINYINTISGNNLKLTGCDKE